MQNKNLILTPLVFYSRLDEDSFFVWLNKVTCVKKYIGIGRELHVSLEADSFKIEDFRELLGMFKRYQLENPEQLNEIFSDLESDDLVGFSWLKVWPSKSL